MIRSSKVSLKFANASKADQLSVFISEYRNVVSRFVDLLWDAGDIPSLLPKEFTSAVPTWLSARALQCAGKQASGIVRGTQKKQKKRAWMIAKLFEDGKPKKAKKLQRIYDEVSLTKPNIHKVNPELDSRFVKLDLETDTSFDGWITLTSLGNKMKLNLPFKRTRHFNKLLSSGEITSGIRISDKEATFMFELPDVPLKNEGTTLGIDIGQTTLLSCSNDIVSKTNKHGHDLKSITEAMCRKRKGSHAFQKCVAHRKNYVNWSINQINLKNVKQVNLENIKHLRRGRNASKQLSHWTYTTIFDKLESYCSERGVLISKVDPTYTSQRCSEPGCGWTRRSNRKGKLFKCGKCGFTCDADLNASRNIALNLPGISREKRLKQDNRKGFYYLAEGQEPIVPDVEKTYV